MWPFSKPKTSSAPFGGQKLYFKSGGAFFEYQCKFGHTSIEAGMAIVALVMDAKKEFGTASSVKINADGSQLAALQVASEDGGFLVFASTPSSAGERLMPDDVVLWVPSIYSEELGSKMSDKRSGWTGLIRAKIRPEIDPLNTSFEIASRYN